MTKGNNNVTRPKLSIISTRLVERIIDEAKDVLEKTGVLMQVEEGLELLGNGGARIDRGKKKAYIPRSLVEESLKSVPSSIKLYDRSGKLQATFEGANSYFHPGASALGVLDSDLGKIRDPVTKDQINIVKLVDALDNIAVQSSVVYPTDVPVEIAGRYRHFLCMRYGTKPIWGGQSTKEAVSVLRDLLVAIRGSEKAVKEKPLQVCPVSPDSPLIWGSNGYYFLTQYAQLGIPVVICTGPTMGATGPTTIAGTAVQQTAEWLSGMVITQLASRGAPIMSGNTEEVLDMRYGDTAQSIESIMASLAYTAVDDYLGILTENQPTTDSMVLDSQSGLESGIGAVLSVLAGVNLIGGPGLMGFSKVTSLEKLVIDNEICGMALRLAAGVAPRGERLAEDLFTEGLYEGKHFLLSPATLKWLREEHHYPGPVINRETREVWEQKGSTTAEQRAKEEVKRILATYEPEPLDEDIDRELVRIMTKNAEKYGMSKLPLP